METTPVTSAPTLQPSPVPGGRPGEDGIGLGSVVAVALLVLLLLMSLRRLRSALPPAE
jgi:hypothetical protein